MQKDLHEMSDTNIYKRHMHLTDHDLTTFMDRNQSHMATSFILVQGIVENSSDESVKISSDCPDVYKPRLIDIFEDVSHLQCPSELQ